jgi:predicted nuclease of predicted toxin-antitoxin system
MKIVLDMNVSPEWVDVLSGEDIECIHWSKVGNWSAEDDDIVHWAATNGFVVMTQDLDFGGILRALSLLQPSVVLLRTRNGRPHRDVADVLAVLKRYTFDLDDGCFIVIDPSNHRVRRLPLS